MGHNGSWISRNASEPRNASGAEAAGANRSALGEFGEAQLYRHFTTTVQVVIFIGSLLGNFMVLWSTCRTTVFKSVTNRFIKNLACSGICASLVCVPFDIILSTSPHCCWWIYTMLFCKVLKFLHKVFCSVTILSFPAIALDRKRPRTHSTMLHPFLVIHGHVVFASSLPQLAPCQTPPQCCFLLTFSQVLLSPLSAGEKNI